MEETAKVKAEKAEAKPKEKCRYIGVRERRKAFGNDWRTFVVRREKSLNRLPRA